MYKILISGYYGFNNIGDESVLRAVVENLRNRLRDIDITVLSHNPADTAEKFGVRAVPRMSPAAILREVMRCDLLISGGGSLLQDATSSKSIQYYLMIMNLALTFGKKVFIYSQGIGPIRDERNRRRTARTLRRVHGVVVRDEGSRKLLCEIGIAPEKVIVTADPVLRIDRPGLERGREILAHEDCARLPNRPLIGWAVKERNPDSHFAHEVERCIRWLEETYHARCVLIPFHYEEDREVALRLSDRLQDEDVGCIRSKHLSDETLSIIGNMDFLVGVRLHSLIYAAVMDVPMLGISYDPKVNAFLHSVGQEAVSETGDFTLERFCPAFEAAWENRDRLRRTVSERRDVLQKKLNTNEDMIAALIGQA